LSDDFDDNENVEEPMKESGNIFVKIAALLCLGTMSILMLFAFANFFGIMESLEITSSHISTILVFVIGFILGFIVREGTKD